MMKYLIILIINIWVVSSFGQTLNWVKTFGGQGYDEGYSATQLADSSYIVVGSTSSFYNSNQNILFMHVDSNGTFLNSIFINNGGYERANKIIPINNNQFWLAGFTNSVGNGGFDGYLVKTDLQGNKIEDFTYGGNDWDFIHDFIMLSDSSLILVGETQSFGHGNKDAYILRVDKLGDTLWTRAMGDTKDDWANSVVLHDDTLLIVGGTEDANSTSTFGLYIALSLNGDSIFQKQVGNSNYQYFNDIINYPFSNIFYLTGTCVVTGDKLLYFHFTDPQGSDLGENIWGNAGGDSEIFATANYPGTSNHVHASTSNAPGSANFYPSTDIIAQKTSPGGHWAGGQVYGHLYEDDANDVISTSDNGVLVIGTNRDVSIGGSNVFLIKVGALDSFPQNFLDTIFPITTSIDEYQFEKLNLFPNPTTDNIYFKIEGFNKEYFLIKIYSIEGVLVYSDQLNEENLNINFLSKGMYYINIVSDKKRYQAKLIKQ